MAKKSKSKSASGHSKTRTWRDPSIRSLAVLPTFLPSPSPVSYAPDLREIEDRRTFHPEHDDRPALDIRGRPAPVKVTNRAKPPGRYFNAPGKRASQQASYNRYGPKYQSQTKAIVTFAAPDQTLVCVRRQRRKEVLFAKKKYGAGNRPGRRTWLSKISCRR